MKQAAALGAILAVVALGRPTHASGEDEWATGVSGSAQFAEPADRRGVFWDIQAEYGLSETFQAGLELGVRHAFEGFGVEALRGTPLLGARLDIVQWVPYVATGPSLVVDTGANGRVKFGADAVAGVDYLWSRSWALGAQYHFTATAGEGAQLLHRAGLRLMYHWGW